MLFRRSPSHRIMISSVLASLALAVGCTGTPGPTGPAGAAGAAASCTVKDDGGGTKTISCTDGTNVTVKDGVVGPTGAAGTDGKDGSSCKVVDNGNGSKTISCTDGSSATVSDGRAGDAGKSCTVAANTDGTSTITCTDGSTAIVRNGENGAPGRSCTVTQVDPSTKKISCSDGTTVTLKDGSSGPATPDLKITQHHGRAFLAQNDLDTAGKYMANAAITSAMADVAGVLTVNFTLKDAANKPLIGMTGMSFNVDKLMPAPTGEVSTRWVPYLMRTQTVTGSAAGGWPGKDGDVAMQGSSENNGVLTDNGDGSYKYVFKTNLNAVTLPVGGTAVSYDRNLTHRVALMMGGHSGATASTTFDFVPDGSAVTDKRDIVQTANCQACHGPRFAAHGGDRLTVDTCSTCHVPLTVDPQSGETVDFKVMIHKIHAGGELASIPGPDGIVFDDPATPADESADNGHYAIWGYRDTKVEWWKAGFPAVIANCTKCHTGTGAKVDNWKTSPSRAACGSCHDTTSFAPAPAPAGKVLHPGGAQATDALCSTCHPASGAISPPFYPIPAVHDFTHKDQRNIPEFTASVTVSTPANGKFFVAGEAPQVFVALKDAVTGVLIDHTTMVEDAQTDATPAGDGLEGCPTDAGKTFASTCPPGDGKFAASNFFVHGPRAHNSPVLTTAARVKIISKLAGPFDLTVKDAVLQTTSLILKVDGGEDLYLRDANSAVKTLAGNITVAVPAANGALIADRTAATGQEIANWLNANTAFTARAIAYLDGGKVAIRSRNKGKMFSIQLLASSVNTAVFGANLTAIGTAASTASNKLAKRIDPTLNDPKVSWATDQITYQLDPVDDLVPGTYVANVEIGDRGNNTGTKPYSVANSYKTPSVARVTFQVGQAAEELPVAANCNSCHQNSTGEGLVFDPARHNKQFDFNATDQCGACHDYQTQTPTGAWSGAVAITRRVHAVHNGAALNFPDITVGHADEPAGRHWQIKLPQDVRNCQACHPDGKVSGTWANKPGRLACGGCHDGLATQNHMKVMTYDPTPADPYSGDEGESCSACH